MSNKLAQLLNTAALNFRVKRKLEEKFFFAPRLAPQRDLEGLQNEAKLSDIDSINDWLRSR